MPPVFLSTLSLRRPLAAGELKPDDLPAVVRDAGFDGLEVSDRLLAGWGEERLDKLAAGGAPLVIDVSADLTPADDSSRRAEERHVKLWIERAAGMGCGLVRLTVGGQGVSVQKLLGRRQSASTNGGSSGKAWLTAPWLTGITHTLRRYGPSRVADLEGKLVRAAGALRRLADSAGTRGVRLAVENHWGITTHPEELVRLIEEVDDSGVGTCPDFANWPAAVDRYDALAQVARYALHVHARAERLDEDGEERDIDYRRCLAILRDAGFSGAFAVEYTGGGDPLTESVRVRELIRSRWIES